MKKSYWRLVSLATVLALALSSCGLFPIIDRNKSAEALSRASQLVVGGSTNPSSSLVSASLQGAAQSRSVSANGTFDGPEGSGTVTLALNLNQATGSSGTVTLQDVGVTVEGESYVLNGSLDLQSDWTVGVDLSGLSMSMRCSFSLNQTGSLEVTQDGITETMAVDTTTVYAFSYSLSDLSASAHATVSGTIGGATVDREFDLTIQR